MLEAKLTCDRCKVPRDIQPQLLNGGAVAGIATLMLDGYPIHVCSGCMPALADFLPGVDRQVFSRHVSYEATVDVSSDGLVGAILVVSAPDGPGGRRVTPASAGLRCLPKQTLQLEAFPGHLFGAMFHPRRFVIDNDKPEEWLVNDIKVANRSQFLQSGDVPGDLFAASTAADHLPTFEICPPPCSIKVVVTYIGKNPEGAVFKSHFEGTVSGFKPPPPKLEGIAAI